MQCPKCYGEMELVSDETITNVNRCGTCHGFHFELLNQQNLDDVTQYVHLDTGVDSFGDEYNEMVYVECPKCDMIMDQRSIDDPAKIRFELCIACHATFLDAGEFREYMSDEGHDKSRELLPER